MEKERARVLRRRGVMRFVRVATLDDSSALPPGAHAFEVYDDIKREWPAESLVRSEAVLGKSS